MDGLQQLPGPASGRQSFYVSVPRELRACLQEPTARGKPWAPAMSSLLFPAAPALTSEFSFFRFPFPCRAHTGVTIPAGGFLGPSPLRG